ncbi:hypothetical protein C7R88_10055 [Plesiomonas shigelloides]|uniref:hypothetical protein n=1 Tax=Plesiomonas shigelloides TaxID=703 RepID=UPI000D129C84|nr:hypothetical protein [Plesiomonas shigelloides]AVQ87607.1 hypothetical protein C7R88_10055 [Plesiomonas shigelloides]
MEQTRSYMSDYWVYLPRKAYKQDRYMATDALHQNHHAAPKPKIQPREEMPDSDEKKNEQEGAQEKRTTRSRKDRSQNSNTNN